MLPARQRVLAAARWWGVGHGERLPAGRRRTGRQTSCAPISLWQGRNLAARFTSSSMSPGGVALRKRLIGILLLILSLASVAAFGQEKKKDAEPLKIKVGDLAPDFTLLEYDGSKIKPVSLHDFKGKKSVALAFFVFAFTGG